MSKKIKIRFRAATNFRVKPKINNCQGCYFNKKNDCTGEGKLHTALELKFGNCYEKKIIFEPIRKKGNGKKGKHTAVEGDDS